MSNFFKNIQVYAGKYSVKAEQKLDAEDIAMFSGAKVVTSEYGKSVCFFLKSGGQQYIPLSTMGLQKEPGESVDLEKVSLQVLERQGSQDILRAKINE